MTKFPKTILFLILLLIFIITAGFFAYQWQQEKKKLIKPDEENEWKNEQEEVLQKENWKIYHNEEFGFEFEYPDDWIFHANTFYSPFSKFNLVGASPEENNLPDTITPSVVVNVVTPDFADRTSMSFKNLNASTSIVIVAGVKVIKYEYEFENLPRIAIANFSLGEYQMLLGASKKYEEVFNQILASFKFLK